MVCSEPEFSYPSGVAARVHGGADVAPGSDALPRLRQVRTAIYLLSPLRSLMFFTYLWRELRRRARQAIFIAIGLALGIGLVITVTAASAGVKNAQASVLHSLYGVGTDITVTKAPAAGSTGNGFGFGFRQSIGSTSRPKAGSKIDNNTLSAGGTLASLASSNVTSIAKMDNVAAAAGGLTLNDRMISGTVPALNFNGGGGGFS